MLLPFQSNQTAKPQEPGPVPASSPNYNIRITPVEEGKNEGNCNLFQKCCLSGPVRATCWKRFFREKCFDPGLDLT